MYILRQSETCDEQFGHHDHVINTHVTNNNEPRGYHVIKMNYRYSKMDDGPGGADDGNHDNTDGDGEKGTKKGEGKSGDDSSGTPK